MKYFIILLAVSSVLFSANAKELSKKEKEKIALEKAMQEEKKFAKEQKFYQGSAYDLKAQEVDASSLDNIESIVPEDDFDMDDVY
jgi:hypothetical protein